MRNDKEFMLNPDRWPETSFWSKRIYLKRGPGIDCDFAQLAFLKDRWGFCKETAPFEPDLTTVEWGGPELIDRIIKEGWIVD